LEQYKELDGRVHIIENKLSGYDIALQGDKPKKIVGFFEKVEDQETRLEKIEDQRKRDKAIVLGITIGLGLNVATGIATLNSIGKILAVLAGSP